MLGPDVILDSLKVCQEYNQSGLPSTFPVPTCPSSIVFVAQYEPLVLTVTFGILLHFLEVYNEDTHCVGFARLGSEDQMILAGTMRQLLTVDFGAPLHCLVIVGETHPVEEEMLDFYKLTDGVPRQNDSETA